MLTRIKDIFKPPFHAFDRLAEFLQAVNFFKELHHEFR